jgi:hypothetical protein
MPYGASRRTKSDRVIENFSKLISDQPLLPRIVTPGVANTSGEQYRFSLLRVSLNPPAIVIFNTAPTLDAL